VASPKQIIEVKKLFNKAYNVERIFGTEKEDPISLFKSELATIAAKRRAAHKGKNREVYKELSRSI
jgi:hypothetical protein